MAAVSTYPTDSTNKDDWLVRGDPVAIPVVINDPDNDQPLSERTWAAHIRTSPDGRKVMEFTIEAVDETSTLLLHLDAAQSRRLQTGQMFDLEEVGIRTWWSVTKIFVLRDVTHDG